jgi:hypothetical protein
LRDQKKNDRFHPNRVAPRAASGQAHHEREGQLAAPVSPEQTLAHALFALFLHFHLAQLHWQEDIVDIQKGDPDASTSLEHTLFRLHLGALFVHTGDAYLRQNTAFQFCVS